ncbi:hypothetical protein MNB_SUP05-4-480 [hydrothermal vent metagenome]|uniref:Uncharacterized protein n=1 Tax=hydrothermal vent metagenome TaxID=652676 RepID=A0A1W1D7B8_9ZZZZ
MELRYPLPSKRFKLKKIRIFSIFSYKNTTLLVFFQKKP